jgi:hypothetical protein
MFGLFKRKPVLDQDSAQWIFAAFEWAINSFGSDFFREDTVLVRPVNEHFPNLQADPGKLAENLFEIVRTFAGMQDWPCELVAQDPDPEAHVGRHIFIEGIPRGPAGTFRLAIAEGAEKHRALITYNPKHLNDPGALVATFAHELAHYLAHSVREKPPGGDDLEEYATDLLAVFMGFGIFQANTAFTFRQFQTSGSQGWSWQRQGYMSQYELVYALAIFSHLKALTRRDVEPFLKNSLVPFYRKALKEIASREELVRLKSLDIRKKSAGAGNNCAAEMADSRVERTDA